MAGRPVGAKTVRYRSSLVRAPDGTFLASVRVPAELLADIGAHYLRFSLDTKDVEEATVLLPYTAGQISGALVEVLAEKRRAELFGWPTAHLQLDSEQGYVALRTRAEILAAIRDACTPAHAIRPEAAYPLHNFETRKLLAITDCFLLDFEIPMKRFTRAYWRLVGRIDRLQRGHIAEAARQTQVSDPEIIKTSNGRREATLFDTITLFDLDHGPSWAPGTRRDYERTFGFLIELFGADTPIRNLTRTDLRRLRGILQDLASNWSVRADLRRLPMEEAAKKSRELDLPVRSTAAIRDSLERVRFIMDFAVAEGLIDRNFAANLHHGLPQHLSYPSHPFTVSELNEIFHHPPLYEHPPPLEQRDGMFWLPLIGLFTGMRLGEIAQLWTRDIAIVERIPLIRILPLPPGEDPREDKRLKTKNSMRVIPIHPELERTGFVAFWLCAQKQGRKRLFPEFLRGGPHHSFGRVSQELTRFIRLATHGNERVSYKSFRHTFRDAARDADLPRERARILGGWGSKDASDRYGIGGSVPRLYQDIKKIHYPGLDLSHLALEIDVAE